MSIWYYPIALSFVAGILCLLVPEKLKTPAKVISFAVSVFIFGFCIVRFNDAVNDAYILKDSLSSFIVVAVAFFGVITVIYSHRYMASHERGNKFYSLVLLTLSGAITAALANDLIVLLVAWGFLALTLYLLIAIGGGESASPAKKTLIIVGGTDALMVMGVLIVRFLAGSMKISEIALSPVTFMTGSIDGTATVSGLAISGFLFLVFACFAKAGAIPFHTWIPDMAEKSPAPVTAFLPASLDKLLGIYLLARISLQLFYMTPGAMVFLMIVGAVTILGAVMMAMIQHDIRRLLAYHAVSQVGYMVLGIGTGNPVGIAGALFHMLNHSIYKSCLFFCGGAIEHRTKTNDLDKLGGLANQMPFTFIACLIAALSISGIPPLNGFFSKWMVYQGLIEFGRSGGTTWVIWITAAMLGSALTLASFTKMIHGTFLGRKPAELKNVKEVNFTMWVPLIILAGLCVLFGVMASQLPIRYFIQPSMTALGGTAMMIDYPGIWWAGRASLMILGGIGLGLLIYLAGNLKGFKRDETYVGGEILRDDERVTGVDFYGTVRDLPVLKKIYALAEAKAFDFYEQGKKFTFTVSERLKEVHTGILRTYLAWSLLGLLALFIFLMMKV